MAFVQQGNSSASVGAAVGDPGRGGSGFAAAVAIAPAAAVPAAARAASLQHVAAASSGTSTVAAGGIDDVLARLVERVPKLHCVQVADKDGVALFQATDSDMSAQLLNSASALVPTFAISSDQAEKLGLGANDNICTYYGNMQVVHVNFSPLVITFVAASDANTGILLAMVPDIKRSIEPVRASVSLEQAADDHRKMGGHEF